MKTLVSVKLLAYKVGGEIIFAKQLKGDIYIERRPEIISLGKEYIKKIEMLSEDDLKTKKITRFEDISIELIEKTLEIEL